MFGLKDMMICSASKTVVGIMNRDRFMGQWEGSKFWGPEAQVGGTPVKKLLNVLATSNEVWADSSLASSEEG